MAAAPPVADLIRKITGSGNCPRLFVNARADDVSVPEPVREEWGHRLILDLDPRWPLHLTFDAEALEADLCLKGALVRCRIPYRAIWGVIDRDTQKGAFFREHQPKEVAPEVTGRAASGPRPVEPAGGTRSKSRGGEHSEPPAAPRGRPKLRVLKGGKAEE